MPVAIQNHKKPFQAGDLPPLSPVGLEISRLSARDEVSASQLARLISKDAALAAKVLRIANSPFYGLRTKVKTLDHAILVLGQVNIASICSAFTVMGALKVPPSPGHDRYNLKILQRHFILTGIVARWMAQHLDSLQMPVTDSFLGGLFHDIGELAIVSFYPQHLQDLWQYEQAHPEIPLYQAERTILGFDHQEIGAAVLHHWQLPQVYIDIAQSHHTARSTADSNNGADSNNVPDSTNEMMVVLLLQAADQVALAMETSVSQMATPARPSQTHWQEHVATFMAPIPNLPSGMAEQLKIDMEHLLEEANVMLEQGGGLMTDDQLDRPFILCVDDEPGIVRSIKRILKGEQVNVLTASSGPEALEILRTQRVALILTDYRMPEMNGIELLEQAAPLCPDAFRIILTGYAEAHVLIDAVNRGQIYKILYKPFQEEDIKLTVRSGLEHHAKNSENRMLLKELEERNRQLAVLNHTLQLGLEGTQADLTISSTALGMAQQLLNAIPAAVIGIEPSGQIVFANQRANDWFAPSEAPRLFSLVGSWFSDLLPESVQECIEEKIGNLARIEAIHLRTKVKPELTLHITCQTFSDGMGGELQSKTVFVFATEAPTANLPLKACPH